jgi:hypothetical protein
VVDLLTLLLLLQDYIVPQVILQASLHRKEEIFGAKALASATTVFLAGPVLIDIP